MIKVGNRNIMVAMFSVVTLLFSISSIQAQKLTVQVSANKVQVGAAFQVVFTVNAQPTTYTPPNFKDFDVFSGPNVSQSTQIMNGNMSQQFMISFLIAAKKEGKLQIGPMTMVVSGQTVASNPVTIEATKGAVPPGQQQQTTQSNQNQNPVEQSANVSGEDVFVKTTVSKTKCYIGEQVMVTQKIYSRLDLRGFQNIKFPSYNGFWSQQPEGVPNVQLQIENIDGVNYYVGEFNKTYIFPQRTGALTIDPTEVECIVRKQSNKKPRNIFEQFFGGNAFEDVVVKAFSKKIKIDVMDVPEADKPANFSGGVGSLNYKVEASKQNLKANDAFNLKITISGRGNLKLLEAPKLTLPESFESYEPKVTENISNTGGVSGSKTYNYLIIPREPGDFVLNGLDFSYFDLDKKKYVTIPSPEIKITVTPGDGKSNASAQVFDHLKQEIKETENDIRFIKKGEFKLQKGDTEFFNSSAHLFLMSLPLILFAGALGYRTYYIKQNSDVVAVKGRKAASFAKKQLVNAEKQMKQNNKEAFYTEVINALNSYLGNKFNIPVADLSRDNITKELQLRQIKPDTQIKLFDAIDQCEYAKYAPGAVSGDLQLVYKNTADLILDIESELKNV
ncbi:MAG TPA: BatD family protein [Bacteroidia bacterium]|nr:BatD family protein [Bacteroidia bacterium]